MTKKIIIIINNLGIGGAERLVVDDINEMLRLGIDVTLITLRPEPPKNFLGQLHLDLSKHKLILFKNLFSLTSWVELVRFIRKMKPDLVITQLWFANTIGRIAARLAGVKKVLSFEQNVYDTLKNRKMFFVDRCLQFLSTKIIAVSEAVKRSLLTHGIQTRRIDVLYNSIDLSKFSTSHNRSEIRRECGVSEQAFLFIFIGRLIYQKAVDILIKAFEKIDQKSYLLIVGQGKDRDVLEQQVKGAGLEERVIFAGVRSDIPQLLLSADCFVLPSRYEGLPLVLTEALAAGITIIVSDFEAAKEIIINGKNGLVVPRENESALTAAMQRIISDKMLRLSLASEARVSAKRFSVSSHVHAILRYIKI